MFVEGPVACTAQDDQIPVQLLAQVLVGPVVNVEEALVTVTELAPVIRLV